MAYLSQVKSNGRQYIYLCMYVGSQEYSTRKERRVYSFGEARKALLRMKRWKRRFAEFPQELLDLGCGMRDLEQWIQTLETGITPKGRKFPVITQKRALF
ncbi:MAG: hypothetical protein CW346_02715 [Bacillaceae bacterium]|uniref:hypothetical protein n=1 Tax=Parageobacillus thermoglucosidasius TaxID=1426 RepID=UPI0001D17A71|nr:hypothetical protein [Parageobacillus thermoglucosidasius]AEH47115.1 hypothetical protein Geoth_1120 [Parageobacillus thermoglucosidasius C56-YS93]MBY6271104.1 hypothetical protein [Bacillaceae bacterium]